MGLYGMKNRDMMSVWKKFNTMSAMTPSTSDSNILAYVAKAKDVMQKIESRWIDGELEDGNANLGKRESNNLLSLKTIDIVTENIRQHKSIINMYHYPFSSLIRKNYK